jgi:hypothetical protein
METHKTVSINSQTGIIALVIFGVLWSCCSLTAIVPAVLNGELFGVVIALVFLLPGIFILGYAATIYYSRARIGKPEVVISNTNLRVGEQFTVNLMHTFKRQVQIDRLEVQLLFKETATYQQGTDTRTVTHEDVYDNYELPDGQYQAGQLIQETYTMQIPADAMHTLKVRRNQLQWFVRVRASVPKLPDFVDEYELTVLPEMAPVSGYQGTNYYG